MTKEEASILVLHAPKEITMSFRPVDDLFVALKAGPCPLYAFKSCLVYAYRPYACRRFACMRPNVRTEPFEVSGANLMDRVKTSRVARRMAERIQRKAQVWADKHGWLKVREREQ
jgi:Fe-S-cluster containining protein